MKRLFAFFIETEDRYSFAKLPNISINIPDDISTKDAVEQVLFAHIEYYAREHEIDLTERNIIITEIIGATYDDGIKAETDASIFETPNFSPEEAN